MQSQQSAKPDSSLSKQPVRKPTALYYDENTNSSRNKCIFEPRPELTYNDINNLYQKPKNTTKRAPVKYIGSHTDSQLNYSVKPSQQPQVQEQKLFRRESIIASWRYLKKEQERALGGHKSIDFENIPPKRSSKVTRSHSAKENTSLRRFSSKRKSVIYSYDPNRKVLNEEYKFASDTESESDRESFAERQSKTLSNFDLELYPYQKSSSFDKLKCMFLRVFGNSKTQ